MSVAENPMSATPPPLPPATAMPSPPRSVPARSVRVRALALWLPVLAVACAALLASYLAGTLGVSPAAAAAMAAALGVVLVALPLAHLVRRVTVQLQPASQSRQKGRGEPDASFLDRATRELARARRYGSGAALLLVDVDRGGRLDDTEVGGPVDAALALLLRQTEPTLRGADLVARFSASQLAVLLSPADATGALDVAERIRERAEQLELPTARAALTAPPRRVTVSIGVAVLRPIPADLASMIEDATEALTAARQAGGNCVRAAPAGAGRLRLPGPRDDRRAQRK